MAEASMVPSDTGQPIDLEAQLRRSEGDYGCIHDTSLRVGRFQTALRRAISAETELKRSGSRLSWCEWCDAESYHPDRQNAKEQARKHTLLCPHHPMRKLEAEIDRLKSLSCAICKDRGVLGDAVQSLDAGENDMRKLREMNAKLAERCAAQSDLLGKKAERPNLDGLVKRLFIVTMVAHSHSKNAIARVDNFACYCFVDSKNAALELALTFSLKKFPPPAWSGQKVAVEQIDDADVRDAFHALEATSVGL